MLRRFSWSVREPSGSRPWKRASRSEGRARGAVWRREDRLVKYGKNCEFAGGVRVGGCVRLSADSDVANLVRDHGCTGKLCPVQCGDGEGCDNDPAYTVCASFGEEAVKKGRGREGEEDAPTAWKLSLFF
jgi:hypothetical protein